MERSDRLMIGERLQELRKDKGLSQAEFAEILGVSHYTVSSYECNRSDPDDNAKITIAKLFDVSVDYLLGLIDEPVSYNRNQISLSVPRDFNDNDFKSIKDYIKFLEFQKQENTQNK
ncbi:MAG: helix-turn-helix domain-containing protein [Ruminococcus sp.]